MLREDQKVFGIGLARTGTTSLCKALNLLGIKTIHYPCGSDVFADLRSGNYRLSVMKNYQGAADIPIAPFYPQLDEVFPSSKFILTLRDEDSWIKSVETHWRRSARWLGPQYPFVEFIRACVFGTVDFHEDRFRYVYRTHSRNVLEYFEDRPSDLLFIDICKGEGWEKLCPFLGVPIPDVPFPFSNQTDGKWDAMERVDAALEGAVSHLPSGVAFCLIGRGRIGNVTPLAPFTGQPALDWGAPRSDEDAIQQINQVRDSGIRFAVFLWSFFWWFEHYPELHSYLQANFPCLASTDEFVIFQLGPERK